MFGLGAGELLIIFVFALLFIGPKKLPELAKSLGKGLKEFQKAKDDFVNVMQQEADATESEETKLVKNDDNSAKPLTEQELIDMGKVEGAEHHDEEKSTKES